MAFTFNKNEKLKSRKQLTTLFAEGKSFTVFPLKVFYTKTNATEKSSCRIGVSATKRNFKKAVDRNRIKRLLREAYRLNKTELVSLTQNNCRQLAVFFLYIDKELPEFNLLQTKMQVALQKLIQKLSENDSTNI
jgi:ribonuclease P protein component